MPESGERELERPGEQKETIVVDGQEYEFVLQEDGSYIINTGDYERSGTSYLAKAAAAFSELKGKEIRFGTYQGWATIKKDNTGITFSSDGEMLRNILEETFDAERQEKNRQHTVEYVSEWLKKPEVIEKFAKVIQKLREIGMLGPYQNMFESGTIKEALIEAANNRTKLTRVEEQDPLGEVAVLIYELTLDLQEPWGEEGAVEGAGFDDFIDALTFVTHESYRQYDESAHLN